MDELIQLLTRERLFIERMLYRASVMRNFLVGGQPRFLAWASDELNTAAQDVRAVELTRATCYQGIADSLGLPETFDWDVLIEAASQPNAVLLRSLRVEISNLVTEFNAHLVACRKLSEDGLASASTALSALQGLDLSEAVPAAHSIDPRKHLNQTL